VKAPFIIDTKQMLRLKYVLMDFLFNNNNNTLANNDTKLLRWSFKLRNTQLWTQTTYSTTDRPTTP